MNRRNKLGAMVEDPERNAVSERIRRFNLGINLTGIETIAFTELDLDGNSRPLGLTRIIFPSVQLPF